MKSMDSVAESHSILSQNVNILTFQFQRRTDFFRCKRRAKLVYIVSSRGRKKGPPVAWRAL